jgi:enoyl-CoA hydratase
VPNPNYKFISLTQAGPKAQIAFNRPDVRNALNRQLIDETLDAVVRVSSDTRVLVLRGAGDKAFAAGADIAELRERTTWTDIDFGPRRELAQRLESAPFPTIAALNGVALGGGFELALACHLRIAADHVKVGLPEIRLGVIPGNGGTVRLSRIVGSARALQMMLLAEQIDARTAEQLGLVNWVVPAADFDSRVDEIAERLAMLPPVAARAIIDCATRGASMSPGDAINNEHRWFQICLASPDKQEGVAAFLEKRPAQFNGIRQETRS